MANEKLTRLYVKTIIAAALIVFCVALIWQKKIQLGLDLRGGSELHYRIRTENLPPSRKGSIVQDTMDVIRKRVDPEGRMELDIREHGKDRFYIQLPGMDPERSRRIEDIIKRAGNLRFCLVNGDHDARRRVSQGEMVDGYVPFLPSKYEDKTGRPLRWRRGSAQDVKELVEKTPGFDAWLLVQDPKSASVTGQDLVDPSATRDPERGLAVGFRFQGKGRVEFERLTEENVGRGLAIVLDTELYSAPTIQVRISGPGIITGNFTAAEVDDLVATLRAGSLPADIELEWNNTVGPQLGQDSIRAGVRASVLSIILVLCFMAVYYLINGLIADFAVMLNILLVLAALSAMGLVLTLPGIAGLVLTLGMAVDANVLINERIREESARGKSLRLAVRSGYARAFVTIVDSNLTTLITALILFGVGTGPVRGFAQTLSLGILISMFTAVWVTRAIVDLLIELGWLNSMPMLQILGKTNISFSKLWRPAMVGSVVCIVVGLSVFFQRGDKKLDTDLTGGFRADIELKQGLPIEDVRKSVSALFASADVQPLEESDNPKRLSVRVRRLEDPQRLDKMHDDLEQMFKESGVLGTLTRGTASWQFNLTTPAPVTEEALRRILEHGGDGYLESDIREIIPQDQNSSEFLVKLRLPVDRPVKSEFDGADRIVRALDDVAASRQPSIEIGEIVTPELTMLMDERQTSERPYLLLKLANIGAATYSGDAVREAIIREIFGGEQPRELQVSPHEEEKETERAKKATFAVRGLGSDLKKIADSKKDTFVVFTFSVRQPSAQLQELHVSLATPMSETALRERLKEKGISDALIRSAIPMDGASTNFVLDMAKLREDKAVEKIKEELLSIFKEQVAAESVAADLTPVDTPPEEPDAETLKAQGFAFYKLSLDKPMQLQEIRANLERVDLADALLGGERVATDVVKLEQEVYLKLMPEDAQTDREEIKRIFAAPKLFRSIEAIGPIVAGEMKNKALLAVLLSCVAIIFYIWFRFGELKFGLAAVIALVHDVLLTAGAVGVADALSGTPIGNLLGFSNIKVNVTMIAAFLTLVGYSINDTIVVFDRIRENMGGVRRRVDAAVLDLSVNQTLSRTMLTGLTTFLVLMSLYLMGGPVLHGFAFVMAFGIITGTYSSVFIASPLVMGWESHMASLRKVFGVIAFWRR